MFEYFVVDHPMARTGVVFSQRGVLAIFLGPNDDAVRVQLGAHYPLSTEGNSPDLKSRVEQAFTSSQQWAHVPLDIQGTDFQKKVWKFIAEIPFGKTCTYSELAQRMGNVKSIRAVATACSRNTLALAIPCHRVVQKSGDVSGYRWGRELKLKLLEWEQQMSLVGLPAGRL